MLAIINYGVGNLVSVKNMLRKVGCTEAIITSNIVNIENASKLILPGVGHFDYGMQQLKTSGLINIINRRVLKEKVPILGICLGAQMLTQGSEEGTENGLGYVDGHVRKFKFDERNFHLKVPHMGWADVETIKDSPITENLPQEPRFYFVHSYHIECADQTDVLMQTHYGDAFTAAFEKDNVIGMQFHPEKSHKYGMAVFRNFVENY